MLSHDSRLRCDLVDLYYTLYGTKRPTCLPFPELAGLLTPQKVDVKKIKPFSPVMQKPSTSTASIMDIKRNSPPLHREGPSDVIIDNNLECVNVEIVSKEVRIKVSAYCY